MPVAVLARVQEAVLSLLLPQRAMVLVWRVVVATLAALPPFRDGPVSVQVSDGYQGMVAPRCVECGDTEMMLNRIQCLAQVHGTGTHIGGHRLRRRSWRQRGRWKWWLLCA